MRLALHPQGYAGVWAGVACLRLGALGDGAGGPCW
jgi:hypothetical protein